MATSVVGWPRRLRLGLFVGIGVVLLCAILTQLVLVGVFLRPHIESYMAVPLCSWYGGDVAVEPCVTRIFGVTFLATTVLVFQFVRAAGQASIRWLQLDHQDASQRKGDAACPLPLVGRATTTIQQLPWRQVRFRGRPERPDPKANIVRIGDLSVQCWWRPDVAVLEQNRTREVSVVCQTMPDETCVLLAYRIEPDGPVTVAGRSMPVWSAALTAAIGITALASSRPGMAAACGVVLALDLLVLGLLRAASRNLRGSRVVADL